MSANVPRFSSVLNKFSSSTSNKEYKSVKKCQSHIDELFVDILPNLHSKDLGKLICNYVDELKIYTDSIKESLNQEEEEEDNEEKIHIHYNASSSPILKSSRKSKSSKLRQSTKRMKNFTDISRASKSKARTYSPDNSSPREKTSEYFIDICNRMQNESNGIHFKLKSNSQLFTATDFINWLQNNNISSDKEHAILIGQLMLDNNLIFPASSSTSSSKFRDKSSSMYTFSNSKLYSKSSEISATLSPDKLLQSTTITSTNDNIIKHNESNSDNTVENVGIKNTKSINSTITTEKKPILQRLRSKSMGGNESRNIIKSIVINDDNNDNDDNNSFKKNTSALLNEDYNDDLQQDQFKEIGKQHSPTLSRIENHHNVISPSSTHSIYRNSNDSNISRNISNTSTIDTIPTTKQDKRLQVLYKRAADSMLLVDIFSFGFLCGETLVKQISNFASNRNDNPYGTLKKSSVDSFNEKGHLALSGSMTSSSVKSKIVRTFGKESKSKKERSNQIILVKKQEIKESMKCFEQFLSLAESFKLTSAGNLNIGGSVWSVLFHQHMAQMFAGKFTSTRMQYIITNERINSLRDSLTIYITWDDDDIAIRTKKFIPVAAELVEFCSSDVDPYSCLLGQHPSKKIIDIILREKLSNPTACKATPGSLVIVKYESSKKNNILSNKNEEEEDEDDDNEKDCSEEDEEQSSDTENDTSWFLHDSDDSGEEIIEEEEEEEDDDDDNNNNDKLEQDKDVEINIKKEEKEEKEKEKFIDNIQDNKNLSRSKILIKKKDSSAIIDIITSPRVPKEDTNKFSYIFGRCLYQVDNNIEISVSVYTSEKHLSVNGANCYDLPLSLKNDINKESEWNIPGLEKFIENPIDTLYCNLMFSDTKKILLKYLKDQNIDINIIINSQDPEKTSIADIYELHKICELCNEIHNNPPKILLENVKNIIDLKVKEFFENIPRSHLFLPTLETKRKELNEIYKKGIMAITKQFAGNCSGCLDQLKLDRRDILSGKTKNELVEWWLSEVNSKTIELLISSFSYKENALPDDYIQVPPSDMKIVKQNLDSLENCKKSNEFMELIEKLKNIIYPQIDLFLKNAKAVLSIQLELDVRSFDVSAVSQTFQERYKELKNSDSSLTTWIEDSIEDIRYLIEMKKMEDENYVTNNPNPHIVPVSGLALGTIARLENEYKTAIELWNYLIIDEEKEENYYYDESNNNNLINQSRNITNVEPIIHTQQVHDAIIAHNFRLAETLLDKLQNNKQISISSIDINEKDKNGLTLLHNAIRNSQFKLCHKLLKMKHRLDIIDKEGNIPLHYCFANHDNVNEQVKLCKKMINANVSVNQKNFVGVTPIQLAIIRGNKKLCKILLEANADIKQLITNTQDSCLHLSVRSGYHEIVRLLLLSKADPVLQSSNGETPLDVAVRLKRTSVVDVFKEFASQE